MKKVKLSKNFYLHEYIDKELYKQYEQKNKLHILVGCIDVKLVKIDQFLRDRFGVCTINNWESGGIREWSGLRTDKSEYYSQFSQHSFGRASDKLFKDATPDEVRQDIALFYHRYYHNIGLTAIEKKVNWVHSDCRQVTGNNLLIF